MRDKQYLSSHHCHVNIPYCIRTINGCSRTAALMHLVHANLPLLKVPELCAWIVGEGAGIIHAALSSSGNFRIAAAKMISTIAGSQGSSTR